MEATYIINVLVDMQFLSVFFFYRGLDEALSCLKSIEDDCAQEKKFQDAKKGGAIAGSTEICESNSISLFI
jgi:hypothetical protein